MPPALVHVTQTTTLGGVAEVVSGELAGTDPDDAAWFALRSTAVASDAGLLLHKALHGAGVDDELAAADPWAALDAYGRAEAVRLADRVAGARLLVLHDPLPLTLAPVLRPLVGQILFRCHVGDDGDHPDARRAAAGLRPYLDHVDRAAFLRAPYVWPGLDPDRVLVVPPGIDPHSSKNRELGDAERVGLTSSLLTRGVLDGTRVLDDGGTGFLDDVARPLVLQVSRWDPLKGHRGVLDGFAALAADDPAPELVLVGPHVDPARHVAENVEVLDGLRRARAALPAPVRRRVHVWAFRPVPRRQEALAVNVLQRAATVVVQNSLREGYGLTVTEAMWKRAAVLVSGAGGLGEQVEHGRTGLVAPDTAGGPGWAATLARALAAPDDRRRWGDAAHDVVAAGRLAEHSRRRQLAALDLLPADPR